MYGLLFLEIEGQSIATRKRQQGENKYAAQCKNTEAKIILLSLQDITTTVY